MKGLDELKYRIALHGETAGWLILILVFLYDPFMSGIRGFLEWSIMPKGYVIAMLGAVLISLSKHFKRHF